MNTGHIFGPSNVYAPLILVLPIVMRQAYYPFRFGAERFMRPCQIRGKCCTSPNIHGARSYRAISLGSRDAFPTGEAGFYCALE
jgi:hypothetical protein